VPLQQTKGDESASATTAEYKRLLANVLDRRPSGTRQRLAAALGKNRSFISQISNPAYATPIPASHIEVIFEICHFSSEEKRQFLDAYVRAHPRRLALVSDRHALKSHTLHLPDLGDEDRNARLHALVADFVRQIARLIESPPKKAKRS
jgi:hypothetical protein